MKIQRYKIFGCFLLVSAIVVSFGFALQDANAGFGETVTTDQMANMFGGGFVFCGDRDCDTLSGGCSGGNTCDEEIGDNCYNCKSGNGQTCGSPAGAGWQCKSTSESCNGSMGSCATGVCGPFIGGDPPAVGCGTRPDC